VSADIAPTVAVVHRIYGPGEFLRMLAPKGHARCRFDIDDGVERRVLVRDLAPVRAGESEQVTS
jgi:hypothetical protein